MKYLKAFAPILSSLILLAFSALSPAQAADMSAQQSAAHQQLVAEALLRHQGMHLGPRTRSGNPTALNMKRNLERIIERAKREQKT